MITKECYLRKLEITRGFNAPCIVLIIGKVLIDLNNKKIVCKLNLIDNSKIGDFFIFFIWNNGVSLKVSF